MAKVLIVDDSNSVRRAVELMLTRQKFDVSTALTVGDAAQLLEEDAIDLVLCDIDLPDDQGFALCEALRDSGPPLIFLAGPMDPAKAERAEGVGAAGVISKPFSSEVLAETVNSHLVTRGGPMDLSETMPALSKDRSRPQGAPVELRGVDIRDQQESGGNGALDALQPIFERLQRQKGFEGAVLLRDRWPVETWKPEHLKGQGVVEGIQAALPEYQDIAIHLQASTVSTAILEAQDKTLLVVPVLGVQVLIIMLSGPGSLGMTRYLSQKIKAGLRDVEHAEEASESG